MADRPVRSGRGVSPFATPILLGAALWGLIGVGSCARPPEAVNEEIRIGVILPLSGPEARTGEEILIGMEMAAESAQKAPPVDLRVVDGKGEPANSARALRDLAENDEVSAAVGGWFASTARTLAAVSQEVDLPLVSLSPLTAARSETPPLALHRVAALGAAAAVFAREDLEATTAAVIHRDASEVARAVVAAFREAFVAGSESEPREIAWNAILFEDGGSRWPAGPEPAVDVIFVAGTGRDAREVAGYSEKTRRAALLTVDGWDPEGLDVLASEGMAVYRTSFYSQTDPAAPNGRLLAACDRMGRSPTPALAAGWDAVRLIRHVASRSGTQRAAIATGLRSGASFSGASGRIEFSATGSVRETPAVSSLSSGGPVFLRRVETVLAPGVDAPNR